MKTKKSSKKGAIAVIIGVVAGFVLLGLIFRAIDHNSTDTDVFTTIAIVASTISIFVASMGSSKTESCEQKSKQ